MRNHKSTNLLIFCAALTFFPAFIGLTREAVINLVVSRSPVSVVRASYISETACENELCRVATHFSLSKNISSQYGKPAVGYYGAFSDSWLEANHIPYDPIESRDQLRLTWFRFKLTRLGQLPAEADQVPVVVHCLSPISTKKLGMSDPVIYIGDAKALSALQGVFEFYNIHLYILCALVQLGVLIFLFSSRTTIESAHPTFWSLLPTTATAFFALLSYSHLPDGLLMQLGLPVALVEGVSRIFWGPAIFFAIIRERRIAWIWSALFLVLVAPGLIDWQYRDLFFAAAYRWIVASTLVIALLSCCQIATQLHFLPYISLMLFDTLVIHGIIRLRAGLYLSPLGIAALPILANIRVFQSIFQHHYLWYQKSAIGSKMRQLRNSNETSVEEWRSLLRKVLSSLSGATNAERVAICYLGLDSPLILGYRKGAFIEHEDGLLPPVFARVVQTKEPLWWVHTSEMAKFTPLQRHHKTPGQYASDYAIVLPIICGGEAYGAMSLTEFDDVDSLLVDADRKAYIEEVVAGFSDLISAQLIRNKEVSLSSLQRQTNELVTSFTSGAVYTSTRKEAVELFGSSITTSLRCKMLYFDHDEQSERLTLLTAVNMDSDLVARWAEVPFRARTANRISPFAIAINERRPVFIDNIKVYYGLLAPQSIEVLEHSQTKSLVAMPVTLGERVLGLITLLDDSQYKPLTRDASALLEQPVKYLAYQLEQFRAKAQALRQHNLLSRFADPVLIEMLERQVDSQSVVVGNTVTGVIIVQDLRGSTLASRAVANPQVLAEKLSTIYRRADMFAQQYGAAFEKGNGDGLITTLPITTESNNDALELCFLYLREVLNEATRLLHVKNTIVVVHRGQIFRGIMGHIHRIAWDTCGRDLVDTFSIEKKAKTIQGVVLAISSAFMDHERQELRTILLDNCSSRVAVEGIPDEVYLFTMQDINQIEAIWSKARTAA